MKTLESTTDVRGGCSVQRLVGRHSWALLINADWMDVREQIEASAIVTDPPYGIQADKASAPLTGPMVG